VDWRVLIAVIPLLSCEHFSAIEQTGLAEKIGMQKMHVNRSLKRLMISSYLLEGKSIGRNRGYKLNPYYDWGMSI
jgi:predicted transcriptional regulator